MPSFAGAITSVARKKGGGRVSAHILHSSDQSKFFWNGKRVHNFLNFLSRAIKVLAANGLVEDSSRKRTLEQLFNHLESEINRITSMKKTLLDNIEEKVVQLLKDCKLNNIFYLDFHTYKSSIFITSF